MKQLMKINETSSKFTIGAPKRSHLGPHGVLSIIWAFSMPCCSVTIAKIEREHVSLVDERKTKQSIVA